MDSLLFCFTDEFRIQSASNDYFMALKFKITDLVHGEIRIRNEISSFQGLFYIQVWNQFAVTDSSNIDFKF